jgi:hypothetical protein
MLAWNPPRLTGDDPATPPGFTPLHDGIPRPAEESGEPSTQSVQGAVEGAPVLDETNSVEFMGERFRLADRVGLMPLLRFANASKAGLDSDDFEGMAAMYAMIRGVIHRPPLLEPAKVETPPGSGNWIDNPHAGEVQRDANGKRLYDETEWQRFQEFAEDESAEGDELMKFVGDVMGVIAARPRQRRAVSSGPSPATSQSSRGSSSLPATIPGGGDLTDIRTLGR